ncbi:MAG: glycosyltransferase [Candidatus Micrarchaeota archaeon]
MKPRPSVFVSVGTDPQPFDRLLKEVDRLAAEKVLDGPVFCQTGYSTYKPKNCEFAEFLNPLEFEKKIMEAGLLILHGGAGGIGIGLQHHKTCIVMPRLFRFGEHANDHQLELVEKLSQKGFVLAAENEAELKSMVLKAKKWKPTGFDGGKRIVALLNEFVAKNFD